MVIKFKNKFTFQREIINYVLCSLPHLIFIRLNIFLIRSVIFRFGTTDFFRLLMLLFLLSFFVVCYLRFFLIWPVFSPSRLYFILLPIGNELHACVNVSSFMFYSLSLSLSPHCNSRLSTSDTFYLSQSQQVQITGTTCI
jgi:hypothetical protein